jgi:hypothetical protein
MYVGIELSKNLLAVQMRDPAKRKRMNPGFVRTQALHTVHQGSKHSNNNVAVKCTNLNSPQQETLT